MTSNLGIYIPWNPVTWDIRKKTVICFAHKWGLMDFRQLRYFLAVGEESSFSRAAERCFISQSAISHQIAKLEHELGTSLFDRSTRSVKLTAAACG